MLTSIIFLFMDIVGVVKDVRPLYQFINRHDQDQAKIKFRVTDGRYLIFPSIIKYYYLQYCTTAFHLQFLNNYTG